MTGKKFNKKNVQKFAASLYEEKGSTIYYRPLCRGVLAKKNGQVVGCILGDLYEEFTGKPVARPLTKEEIKYKYILSEEFLYLPVHLSKEDVKSGMFSHLDENDIISELCEKATLKDYNINNQTQLETSLYELVNLNDKIKGESEHARIRRAKAVQGKLMHIADTFLR